MSTRGSVLKMPRSVVNWNYFWMYVSLHTSIFLPAALNEVAEHFIAFETFPSQLWPKSTCQPVIHVTCFAGRKIPQQRCGMKRSNTGPVWNVTWQRKRYRRPRGRGRWRQFYTSVAAVRDQRAHLAASVIIVHSSFARNVQSQMRGYVTFTLKIIPIKSIM